MKKSVQTLAFSCALAALGGLFVVGSASAQDSNIQAADIAGHLPLAQAARPVTLTEGTVRVDGEFALVRASFCFTNPLTGTEECAGATGTRLRLGGGYGISDDLEVGVSPFNAQLTEDFNYGADLYATFRFLQGDFEAAAGVDLTIGNLDPFSLRIRPHVPLRLHLGDTMRLDFDPSFFIDLNDGDSAFGLGSPIQFTVNLTPSIWIQPRTGFAINNFDAAGDSITVPLGIQAGYTLPAANNGPMLDIYAAFDVPFFINTFGGDTVSFDVWQISVGGNFYLDM